MPRFSRCVDMNTLTQTQRPVLAEFALSGDDASLHQLPSTLGCVDLRTP